MSITFNIKINFNNISRLQQMTNHQLDSNININHNQSFNNCINQSSSSNQSNIKKPKIKDDVADSYKVSCNQSDRRLTRKNLNSYHFNDRLGYRKTMNKVESWLNDYPKSGVLYPYFDLSDEKNR